MAITSDSYVVLDRAFEFFNKELFEGVLEPCLITFQRRNKTRGYYKSEGFVSRDGDRKTDEIALNPSLFVDRDDESVLSTLVHEMVHQYHKQVGKSSRGGYHNRQWADLMIEVGLIPSTTGQPGGKQTGQSVSHYVEEGGDFQVACRALLSSGPVINWESLDVPGKSRKRNKVKYSCPCGQNVWGKPEMMIICGGCDERFEEVT